MKVLVTGGAGFIGSHVVESFLDAGHEVVVIDDLSSGKRANLSSRAAFHELDVTSPAARALVANGDFAIVAHLAAQIDVRKSILDPMADARTNVLGALNLLEGVRALPESLRPRVIFASTGGALYGEFASFPTAEESPANPDSPYGVAKLATELYLGYFARVWKLSTTTLRFGNVYGPRQDPHGDAGVIAIFAGRLLAGESLLIYGDGSQTRDYIFVGDVAAAFLAAAAAPDLPAGAVDTRAFNIGTGVETSVAQLAHAIGVVAGKQPDIQHAPPRPGELPRSLLDPSKAAKLLGWQASVSLHDGLKETIAWIKTTSGDAK